MIKTISIYSFLLCCFVSGCAKPRIESPSEPLKSWRMHEKGLKNLSYWTLEGKMGIRYGEEGENAKLTWVQKKEQYTIRFSSTLSIKTIEINGNSKGVVLKTSEGHFLQDKSAEKLIQKESGWSIPFENMKYWIKGIPAPTGRIVKKIFNEFQLLDSLKQEDWEIQYKDYGNFEGYLLPRKIIIQQNKLVIKLILSDWSFPH